MIDLTGVRFGMPTKKGEQRAKKEILRLVERFERKPLTEQDRLRAVQAMFRKLDEEFQIEQTAVRDSIWRVLLPLFPNQRPETLYETLRVA
jgi:hypothetical protein